MAAIIVVLVKCGKAADKLSATADSVKSTIGNTAGVERMVTNAIGKNIDEKVSHGGRVARWLFGGKKDTTNTLSPDSSQTKSSTTSTSSAYVVDVDPNTAKLPVPPDRAVIIASNTNAVKSAVPVSNTSGGTNEENDLVDVDISPDTIQPSSPANNSNIGPGAQDTKNKEGWWSWCKRQTSIGAIYIRSIFSTSSAGKDGKNNV